MNSLRPSQKDILKYTGGKMGISAVPGSGKTWTLSLLAANLILERRLDEDQEILIVTLTNSAVDNFALRINSFIEASNLIPNLGYRVRTLHGLAHDIVRERPSLLGLSEQFTIVDEREAESILNEVALAWLRNHPHFFADYLRPDLDAYRRARIEQKELPKLVQEIAASFIRSAKDLQLSPESLSQRLDQIPLPLPLAEMGCELFGDYQRSLTYRGGIDFDDLICLALRALELDEVYLERLRERWPYILEDEAQDSSRLQNEILKKIAGEDGNWVRVGDPNQVIFETFTTANPKYFRNFLQSPDTIAKALPNSGRSTQSIIDLANTLVIWTQQDHPLLEVRDALQGPPWIEPTPPDDPQPNPPNQLSKIYLSSNKMKPEDELRLVTNSLASWLPKHPDWTVAALTPNNRHGFELANWLKASKLPYEDSLLRSSTSTRSTADKIATILKYLAEPRSPAKLAATFRVWQDTQAETDDQPDQLEQVVKRLQKISKVEDFIWPGPGQDWLESSGLKDQDGPAYQQLLAFREIIHRWQGSVLLPVDQIVLTISQDLFSEPAQLALAHKLAIILRRASQVRSNWRLPELIGELAKITERERKFLGFSQEDTGFDPEQHKGKVVLATLHKAKGLEWDRVYLLSINTYDFPSGAASDQFIAEKSFLQNSLNLPAEALEQLNLVFSHDPYAWYEPGRATQNSRLDYVRERLRLLYVGITRAKKELAITWNTGSYNNQKPALALTVLQAYWPSS